VVLGVNDAVLSRQLQKLVMEEGEDSQQALDCEALERLGDRYQHLIEEVDCVVPEDAMEQLEGAAQAVFRSWMSNRAQTYRELQHLEHLKGTAVTIQAMVYGNRGTSSGAGVAFSRDPSTGAEQPVIDVLFESQGEDVVSGSRTPETEEAIARSMPRIAAQLRETLARLEHEFADVQDVEFTIEDGKLWMLQTRSAKRTPLAAIRFAADFVRQGMITPREALKRLDGLDVNALSRSHLVNAGNPIAHGVGASPGIAIGRAAFSPESAQGLADGGDPVILIRSNISTADVAAFSVSAGILTAVGGRTAHAALVARQLGKTCVVGCTPLSIDGSGRHASLADAAIKEGDWLTLDGDAGHVYLGRCEVAVERPDAELAAIESWRKAA
jgi:pyruvate,orthophosphate dikinase